MVQALSESAQRHEDEATFLTRLEYYNLKIAELAHDDNADIHVKRMLASANRMTALIKELSNG